MAVIQDLGIQNGMSAAEFHAKAARRAFIRNWRDDEEAGDKSYTQDEEPVDWAGSRQLRLKRATGERGSGFVQSITERLCGEDCGSLKESVAPVERQQKYRLNRLSPRYS